MAAVGCPKCGTRVKVKAGTVAVCSRCSALVHSDEDDDRPRQRRRKRSDRDPRQLFLWCVLGICTLVSLILVAIAIARPQHHQIAVWYGVSLFVVTGVMLSLVIKFESDRGNSDSMATGAAMAGGAAGVGLYFLLRYSFRWPQPLLTGFLSLGTLIGAVAFNNDPPSTPPRAIPNATNNNEKAAPAQEKTSPSPWDPPAPANPPRRPPAAPLGALPEEPPEGFTRESIPPPATEFPGLVAYWTFDEGNGTTPVDAVSKSAGVLRGGRWIEGVRGRAIELDGANGAFFPGRTANLDVAAKASFTVAVWVRTTQKQGTVFAFRSHPDGLTMLGLWLVDGKPHAWIRHNGGVFYPSILKDTAPLVPGEWHHLALMRHPDTRMELFVNGVSVEHQALARETEGPLTTNARAFGMEPIQWKEGDWFNFSGGLDEFCMFNRALTVDEVAKLAGRAP